MCMVSNVNKTTCNLFYLKIVGKIGVHAFKDVIKTKQNKIILTNDWDRYKQLFNTSLVLGYAAVVTPMLG